MVRCRACKKRGACIQCAEEECCFAIHPLCALEMNRKRIRSVDTDNFDNCFEFVETEVEKDGEELAIRKIFCSRHLPDRRLPSEDMRQLSTFFGRV
mmetsp:Transcript_19759/g.38263  ORF Transcript_19759/g.38263 Transcript_19759/m.38263 type:complete len:96 (+) Transcript_19759:1639-1926(+)